MKYARRLISWAQDDRGQSTILFAIIVATLILLTGLVVEGGRVLVEYRKLQAAADMAAIVGAQKLPCGTTDTTCIANAETQACTYATYNGFSTCSTGGNAAPAAIVPPISCSPYDFMDYGNGSTNASCKTATSPPFYDYIEVRLTDNLGTVPIFNLPVSLYAHAVAKHGVGVPGDYAVIALSPTGTLTLAGSNVTSVVGSVFSNGNIQGDGGTADITCNGGWFAHGIITGVRSNESGVPSFTPAGCSGGALDGTTLTRTGMTQIQDPYSGSVPPPTLAGNGNTNSPTFTGCPECSQPGWWFDFTAGKNFGWHQGGSPSGHVEVFPGIYNQLPNGGGPAQQAYFNPGVYTLTNGIQVTGGGSCVYGAPSCDDATGTCNSTQFTPGSAAASLWYYRCSPFGFWDSSNLGGNRPASLPTTAPTFYDTATGSYSTVPLNGVVFYLPPNSNGDRPKGNSGTQGTPNYIAAPNPCPGTGSSSPTTVTWPSGAAGGTYTYLPTSLAFLHGTTTSPNDTYGNTTWSQVYPSMDLSLLGECNTTLEAWAGELPRTQHLEMLFYVQGPNSDSTLVGTAAQNYYGIFYAPNSDLTFLGNSQTAAGGAPWLAGQVVTNTDTWSGNSTISVWYRPCGPGSTACGSGTGTQIVQ